MSARPRPPRDPATTVDRRDAVPCAPRSARCRGRIVERHAAYLTRLDTVLGDGDHGDNLVIGFRAVDALLAELPAETRPGELLRAVGHRLVAAVGGASGPLYGTAFLEAGAAAGDAATLDGATLARDARARPPTGWRGGGAARSATRRSSTRSRRRPTPSGSRRGRWPLRRGRTRAAVRARS